MEPKLSDLIELACSAGKILRDGYGTNIRVERKGTIDLVTEIDHRSEAFLLDAIQDKFPHHKVITEESAGKKGADDHVWYIDPLDGTINYAHGVPVFSVSVAYVQEGQLFLGVVYDPMMDECFSAELGEGAWLNGRPLGVCATSELKNSLLVTGFFYDVWTNPDNNLNFFSEFTLKSQGVRRIGSAAIDLAYVAAGRFDGYWELRLNPWDLAAGGLIAREAGALVTSIHGDVDLLQPPYSIIAATPRLHPQMMDILNKGEAG
jgi:myo-inositol-1(or 4)-monophosphatase